MYIDRGSSPVIAKALVKLCFMLGEARRCPGDALENFRRGLDGVGEARRSQDKSERSPKDSRKFYRQKEAQERPRRRLREVIDFR